MPHKALCAPGDSGEASPLALRSHCECLTSALGLLVVEVMLDYVLCRKHRSYRLAKEAKQKLTGPNGRISRGVSFFVPTPNPMNYPGVKLIVEITRYYVGSELPK